MSMRLLLFIGCFLLANAFNFTPKLRSKSLCSELSMTIKLTLNEEEPIESILKRFKRSVNQSGHLMELRHRERWQTKQEVRKRKAEKARLLNRIERTNDKYEKRGLGITEYNS